MRATCLCERISNLCHDCAVVRLLRDVYVVSFVLRWRCQISWLAMDDAAAMMRRTMMMRSRSVVVPRAEKLPVRNRTAATSPSQEFSFSSTFWMESENLHFLIKLSSISFLKNFTPLFSVQNACKIKNHKKTKKISLPKSGFQANPKRWKIATITVVCNH